MNRAFEEGQLLSKSSKDRLKEIFINYQNDPYARKHALKIWISSPNDGDLEILQTIPNQDEIYDQVLMARAQYKDLSIVNQLVVKIREDDFTYWWQASRYIWHEKFEEVLEEKISSNHQNTWWMLGEILEKLSIDKTEQILLKYWDNINQHNVFIHLALLIATEKLIILVSNSIQDRNLEEVFKYITRCWGFKTKGRKGIYRFEQVLAIKPYIQYLDDLAKVNLFEICLKHGWKDFAIEFIDPLIPNDCPYSLKINTKRLSEELQEGRIIWSGRWLHDCIDQGWNLSESVEILMSWLEHNYCDLAVDIVSSNLEYFCSRNDFLRIKDFCEIKGTSENILETLEQGYWSIYSRTLN